MKIAGFFLVLILAFMNSAFAQKNILAKKIKVHYKNTPLKDVLGDVSKQTGIPFSYSKQKIPVDTKINLVRKNIRIKELLEELYLLTGVKYELVGNQVVLSKDQKENIRKILKTLLKDKYTISGYIKDNTNGEALSGAAIYFPELKSGATSNTYGFFSISLNNPDSIDVSISYLGYKTQYKQLVLDNDVDLDIELEQDISALNEVEIYAENNQAENVNKNQMGTFDIPVSVMNKVPVVFGEADPLKIIQLLPGVQAGQEGTTGFFVRGGNADQNLVILDDAVVYKPDHLFGLFSTFNGRAINKVSLTKGGFPANYGGRLSSVLDISMKEGDLYKTNTQLGLGVIAADFTIDGPIQKGKSSFMFSARRTYIDYLMNKLESDEGFGKTSYYFYDINAKVNFKLGDKDRLYFTIFAGQDEARYPEKNNLIFNLDFGNSTATIRWNHLFNNRLFVNTSFILNDFELEVVSEQNNFTQEVFTGINDVSLKTDFEYYPNARNTVKFGGIYTYHTYSPTANNQTTSAIGNSPERNNTTPNKYVSEAAIYINDNMALSSKLSLNLGFRVPFFFKNNTAYLRAESRLALRYKLNNTTSLKMAYTRMNQFVNLVPNSTSSIPANIYIPSSETVKPQLSRQVAFGVFKNFANNYLEASIETYYKSMNNQVSFKEGATLDTQTDIDDQLVFGRGWSYGSELFLKKNKGRLTGWLSYTLSWTWQKFEALNFGDKFPFTYDRRHNLSLTASYKINKHWSLSSNFVFRTGNVITLPEGRININYGGTDVQDYYYDYNSRNNHRLPVYHRLDISATYTKKSKLFGLNFDSELLFSIYNVYNRLNTYFVYLNVNKESNKTSIEQVYLMPIIPTISYHIKF